MPEQSSQPGGAPAAGGHNLGVPIAIVLAGALIAFAVYFGRGPAGSSPTVGGLTGSPAALPERAVGPVRPVTEEDHVRGAQNASITLIEYSDLECPFCKRFHPTLQQVLTEYPNDVRWVYRHFPLETLHQQARAEAVAVECAGEHGKFWELTDLIYETTQGNDSLDLTTLPALAAQAGVTDAAAFEACLTSDRHTAKIDADLQDAQAAGGTGTPYTVVIGPDGTKRAINGAQPYSVVKATIEELL